MMKNKIAVALAAMSVSLSAVAAPMTIDLFSTSQDTLYDTVNGTTAYSDGLFSEAGSAGDLTILGGYRDIWVSALSGASTSSLLGSKIGVSDIGDGNGGLLRFSNDTGVRGVAEVQWDGNDKSATIDAVTGLGGISLAGFNFFEITTIESDLGYTIELTIYSGANKWTKVNLDAHAVTDDGTPVVSYIDLAAFSNPFLCPSYGVAPDVNGITCGTDGVADLTNVTALVARINAGDPFAPGGAVPATTNIDLRLTSVRAVPEPASLALAGLGLLGLGALRRRKQA